MSKPRDALEAKRREREKLEDDILWASVGYLVKMPKSVPCPKCKQDAGCYDIGRRVWAACKPCGIRRHLGDLGPDGFGGSLFGDPRGKRWAANEALVEALTDFPAVEEGECMRTDAKFCAHPLNIGDRCPACKLCPGHCKCEMPTT